MANTIGYGQGAVNNTNGFGKAPTNNTIDFGEVCADSWSPETNLVGGSSFSNLQSTQYDGIDDYVIANVDGTSTGGVLASADTDINVTVSLWFKVPSLPGSQKGIFQWANILNDTTPFLLLQLQATGNIRFLVDGGYRLTTSISTGVWYNFVTTRTASSNTWTFYLNGSSIGTYDDGGTITNRSSAASIYLGNGYNGYFNGFIDEVAIWNNDRSSDVSTIYNSGVPNNLNDLSNAPYNYWRFEGSGTTATDSGSGGNDGTLTNGVTRSSDVPT